MSFWKRWFSSGEAKVSPMVEDLQQIVRIIMPEIHPHDYQYKETFFKTSIKFQTSSRYSEQEMKRLTRLPSVQLVRKSGSTSHWKAPYMEFLSLYSSPAILFAQKDVHKMIMQLKQIGEHYAEYESLIKFEETVKNIRKVLEDSKEANDEIDREVLDHSIHLLQEVIYAFESELHDKNATNKKSLMEKLHFESEFMKKQ